MEKKILILAANPTDTSRLRLDKEVREIDNGLQRAKKRDEFILKSALAARPVDVRRAMLDFKPDIVHFCGHGMGKQGIAFEEENGKVKLVETDVLAGFFELFADRVKCIVLNACYSESQAEAIAQHIDYVIGMKEGIKDSVAIEFAIAFYDALGAGGSVDFAYKLACNAIKWIDIPSGLIPVLKSKSLSDKSSLPKPFHQREKQLLRHYIYVSQSKLDMFWSQIRKRDIQETAAKLELEDLTDFSKLEIIENYIKENFQVGNVNNSQTFFEGSLSMISAFIQGNDSSYVYFGDTQHRVALVGSRKHMYGLSQRLVESFSHEFSCYLVPRIVRSLHSSTSDNLLTAQEMSDFGYNNYSLHIKRVNRSLMGPPQQFRFFAKRLWQFSDCVLGTPLYVAME